MWLHSVKSWIRKFGLQVKWIFCLTTAKIFAANQGHRMTKRSRWAHSTAFKAKVALAAVKGEKRWPNWRSSSMSIHAHPLSYRQEKAEPAAHWGAPTASYAGLLSPR